MKKSTEEAFDKLQGAMREGPSVYHDLTVQAAIGLILYELVNEVKGLRKALEKISTKTKKIGES